MNIRYAAAALVAIGIILSGCGSAPKVSGGGYYQDDGPQDRIPVDVATIPDAVPRDEPLSAYGNKPYNVFGVSYTPLSDARGYRERGVASWYGRKFHGKRTSSGEPYDMYAMTAAHRTLPLPSYLRIRNLENGRSVVVRVNDRGPFLHNRLVDLSYAAAARLGIVERGTGVVEVEALSAQPPKPSVSLIARAEASEAPAPATPPTLAVQVGAFQQYENAVSLRERLERAGLGPIHIEPAPETASNNRIYRVRIATTSVEQGDRLVNEVARFGIRDALLVVD